MGSSSLIFSRRSWPLRLSPSLEGVENDLGCLKIRLGWEKTDWNSLNGQLKDNAKRENGCLGEGNIMALTLGNCGVVVVFLAIIVWGLVWYEDLYAESKWVLPPVQRKQACIAFYKRRPVWQKPNPMIISVIIYSKSVSWRQHMQGVLISICVKQSRLHNIYVFLGSFRMDRLYPSSSIF